MTHLLHPTLLLWVNVCMLMATAFCMAWICRQLLADTHGHYAFVFRAAIAVLAAIYAVQAWHYYTVRPVPQPVEILRNVAALVLSATAIGFHRSFFQRL